METHFNGVDLAATRVDPAKDMFNRRLFDNTLPLPPDGLCEMWCEMGDRARRYYIGVWVNEDRREDQSAQSHERAVLFKKASRQWFEGNSTRHPKVLIETFRMHTSHWLLARGR